MAAVDAVVLALRLSIAISQLGSLSVLLTGLVFWDKLVAGKMYMQILLMTCITDLIGIHMVFYQPEEKIFCFVQGLLWTFFVRASWLWCTMIPVTLFTQIKYNYTISMTSLHAFVWGFNGLLAGLPEMFGTRYGGDSSSYGDELCIFRMNSTREANRATDWYVAVMIVPSLSLASLGVAIVLYLYSHVERRYKGTEVGTLMLKLINNVSGYPVGLAVFWIPFYTLYIMFNEEDMVISTKLDNVFFNAAGGFAFEFGVFMTVLFFVKSHEARQLWKDLLYRCVYGQPPRDDGIDHGESAGDLPERGDAASKAADDIPPESFEPDFEKDVEVIARLSQGETLSEHALSRHTADAQHEEEGGGSEGEDHVVYEL